MNNDVALLLKKRQEQFIETRTRIESEVDAFLKSVEALDETVRNNCSSAPGATAKECLPSLWVEPFNKDVYDAELKVLNDYIARVRSVCDTINKEAMECLKA